MFHKYKPLIIFSSTLFVLSLFGCNSEVLTLTPTLAPTLEHPTITPLPLPSATPTQGPRINTTTSGNISQDETWRDEIHITGDIVITNNATLTIEPGTKVFIASNSDDRHAHNTRGCFDEYTCSHNDPTLLVGWGANAISILGTGGSILAKGTTDKQIEFLPEGSSTSPAQWDGIEITKGTIQYSLIKYAGHGAIVVKGRGIEIAHNTIVDPFWVGIDVFAKDVWVHHNTIYGGGHQAIGVKASSPLIEHNFIFGSNTGIYVEFTSDAKLRNNIIVDSGVGIETDGKNNASINNVITFVQGLPDGWYYQGKVVYPVQGPGVGIIAIGSAFTIQNNIVSGSQDVAIALPDGVDEESTVSHNLVFGVRNTLSEGNRFTSDGTTYGYPGFVDPQGYNFRLVPGSLAIDGGVPEILDPDGSISDLGAYGGPQGDW